MRRGSLVLVLLCAPFVQAQGKFAGKWETNYGVLTMTQSGKDVKGSYYSGGGSLVGTVEKNKLVFTYKEPNLEGDGEFELSADGKSFTGKWRSKGGQVWNTWDGKLVGEVQKIAPGQGDIAGTWDTTYGVVILKRDGNKVKGTYYDGAATIEGTFEKGRLTFRFVENIGKGDGEFTLGADGKSFTGRWRWDNDNTWNDWKGTLTKPGQ